MLPPGFAVEIIIIHCEGSVIESNFDANSLLEGSSVRNKMFVCQEKIGHKISIPSNLQDEALGQKRYPHSGVCTKSRIIRITYFVIIKTYYGMHQ